MFRVARIAPLVMSSAAITPPAHADEMRTHQRAAVGAVAHEYDAGGPYVRAEIWTASDDGGFAIGISAWSGERQQWGLGSPITLHGAIVAELVRLGIGGGVDLVHFDRADRRTGVGLLAPIALVEIDVPLVAGIRVGVEARAEYRWKSFGGARQQAELGAGFTLAVPLEAL